MGKQPKSKAQAGLYGLVAAGLIEVHGLTPTMARDILRGSTQKHKPQHVKPRPPAGTTHLPQRATRQGGGRDH